VRSGKAGWSSNQVVDARLPLRRIVSPVVLGELLDAGRDIDGVPDQRELQLACAADREDIANCELDPEKLWIDYKMAAS
jgi:hypothetical protein